MRFQKRNTAPPGPRQWWWRLASSSCVPLRRLRCGCSMQKSAVAAWARGRVIVFTRARSCTAPTRRTRRSRCSRSSRRRGHRSTFGLDQHSDTAVIQQLLGRRAAPTCSARRPSRCSRRTSSPCRHEESLGMMASMCLATFKESVVDWQKHLLSFSDDLFVEIGTQRK